jgi:hypothetical protein
MIEDYICGEKFKNICDTSLEDYKDINKDTIILYANTENQKEALYLIELNNNKKFILVTHNSDKSVNKTDLPENLIKWYAQNLDYEHNKIEAIPIGLENPEWHPFKLDKFKNFKPSNKRVGVFGQFNPATNPAHRMDLIAKIKSGIIWADLYYCLNGKNFDEYLDNMSRYKFCLCPRGNGIDTHRIWESLYLGCVPVVLKHKTHEFMYNNLPVVFIDNWEDFDENTEINNSNCNNELLTMTYWKNKIFGELN